MLLFLSPISPPLFCPEMPPSLPSSPPFLSPSLFLCPTQAVNQAGAGPYSEQVSFRTPATNPDPVSSLLLLDLPASSESGHSPSTCLYLKWDEPNSNGAEITSYVITLDDQTITVESGTSHLVTDLQPDSEYRYCDLCWWWAQNHFDLLHVHELWVNILPQTFISCFLWCCPLVVHQFNSVAVSICIDGDLISILRIQF